MHKIKGGISQEAVMKEDTPKVEKKNSIQDELRVVANQPYGYDYELTTTLWLPISKIVNYAIVVGNGHAGPDNIGVKFRPNSKVARKSL